MPLEPYLSITGFPKGRYHPVPLQPLLRKQSIRAIAKRHTVLAARDSFQQLRHFHGMAFEIGAAVELEPVHTGRDLQLEFCGPAVLLAVRFHAPAFRDELAHSNGQARGRQLPLVRGRDRKSSRLNSSHVKISYAVFCLKKK